MSVNPIPLDPDDRLARWVKWSDSWHSAWCDGANWMAAASWFFREKFSSDDPMFRYRADWLLVGDPVEQCGRLDRGKNSDLVWRFITLGGGKWRPKLIGTVTEG